MKILIRGVNWIGDAVMMTAAVRGVRALYPHAEISLLVNPAVAELYRAEGAVDEIIVYDKKGVHRPVAGLMRLISELRSRRFDVAVLFQNAIEAALISFLAGIPVRAGYDTEMRRFLLTRPVQRTKEIVRMHQVYYYLNIIEKLGKTGEIDYLPDPRPVLVLHDSEKEWAKKTIADIPGSGMIVGMNPGAAYGQAKMWLPERFAAVADALCTRYNARVIIFGGKNEAGISARVKSLMKNDAVDLGGKTTVRELMALISRCNLFITNDSGPMHIASAFDIPLVAIFGSTDTTTTSPFGTNKRIVKKETECSPCLLRECPKDEHLCMSAVTMEDVLSAAEELAGEMPVLQGHT